MRVRRLDQNHDWTFGQGYSNYATQSEAIAQCVKTRLWSFINDWFLDLEHGLPYLEITGRNTDLNRLEMQVKRQVLSIDGLLVINDYQAEINSETRHLTLTVSYTDIYGTQSTVNREYGN